MNFWAKVPFSTWIRILVLAAAAGVLLMMGGSLLEEVGGEGSKSPSLTPVVSDRPLTSAGNAREGEGDSYLLAAQTNLEQRVRAVLEQIAGVGRVEVCISLAASPQYDYAVNVKKDQREISEKDEKGGTRLTTEQNQDQQLVLLPSTSQTAGSPLIVKEVSPEIKGVLVVCEGATDARVREELTQTVQTVLNIPAYRITVMPKTTGG
ncbi:MAG: hypothetical protein QHH02_05670 [Syntrophomonadaceae bacterium]|nr:hypothetical protein [Syntrophomonadaceae bacterium]